MMDHILSSAYGALSAKGRNEEEARKHEDRGDFRLKDRQYEAGG